MATGTKIMLVAAGVAAFVFVGELSGVPGLDDLAILLPLAVMTWLVGLVLTLFGLLAQAARPRRARAD